MNRYIGIIVCLVSMSIVLSQYWAAARRGFARNFLKHGGMWGDFLIVSPLLGLVAQRFGGAWSVNEWSVALTVSAIVSCGMAWMWAKDPTPSSHTSGGHQTLAGWIHLGYMIPSLAAIGLLYFRLPHGILASFIVPVSAALMLHMVFGTHMVMGLLIKWGLVAVDSSDRDYLRDKGAWWTLGVTAALLAGMTWLVLARSS
ncbi:MAG: hypothetical protein WC763_01490 [Candidatus Paceibacterota bacterium]